MLALSLRQGFCCCVYLCVFLMSFQAIAKDEDSAIVEQIKRAVVVVTTFDVKGKPLAQGSGFFISANRIVTNFHVIKNSGSVQVKIYKSKVLTVAKIIAFNDRRDIALLELNQSPANICVLPIVESPPQEGSQIFVVSNPRGSSWKVTKGNAESVWDFQGIGELLQISAAIHPGSSGGPVTNDKGQVVGIAVMRTNSAIDLNFAIPAIAIKELQENLSNDSQASNEIKRSLRLENLNTH